MPVKCYLRISALTVAAIASFGISSLAAADELDMTPEALLKEIEQVGAVLVPRQMAHEEIQKNLEGIGCYLKPQYISNPTDRSKDPFNADLGYFKKGADVKKHSSETKEARANEENCFEPFPVYWNGGRDESVTIKLGFGFDQLNTNDVYHALEKKYGVPVVKSESNTSEWWIFPAGNFSVKLMPDLDSIPNYEVQILPAAIYKEAQPKKNAEEKRSREQQAARSAAAEKAKTYKGRVLGFFNPGETDTLLIEEVVKLNGCSMDFRGNVTGPCVDLPGNPKVSILRVPDASKGGSQLMMFYVAPAIDLAGKSQDVTGAFAEIREKLTSKLNRLTPFMMGPIKCLAYGDSEMVVAITDGLVQDGPNKTGGVFFLSKKTYEIFIGEKRKQEEALRKQQNQKQENLKKLF